MNANVETHAEEISQKKRFAFGANWQSFLETLDDQRIENAEDSLRRMLQVNDLAGKSFLDIGSGSGLFSLAAKRLGATVHSFDYDPQAVACTAELKRRYFPDDDAWTVEQGSAMDEAYLTQLGQFDVVYSWGVLQHTGNMAEAIRLASNQVREGGVLFIAIFNDQGGSSRRWHAVKKLYNRLPTPLRPLLVLSVASLFETKFALVRLLQGKNPLPLADWRAKKKDRGMSAWHDWVDWCGGLPFEVAKPEDIIVPLSRRGFCLENLTTCGSGWGCNQYVLRKCKGVSPQAPEDGDAA